MRTLCIPRNALAAAIAVVFVLSRSGSAMAADVYWRGYTNTSCYLDASRAMGSWFDPQAWSSGAVPGVGDQAIFVRLNGGGSINENRIHFGDFCAPLSLNPLCTDRLFALAADSASIHRLNFASGHYTLDMGPDVFANCYPPGPDSGSLNVAENMVIGGYGSSDVSLQVTHGDFNVAGIVYIADAPAGNDTATLRIYQGGHMRATGIYLPTYWTLPPLPATHTGYLDVAEAGSSLTAGSVEVGGANNGTGNTGTFTVRDGGLATISTYLVVGLRGGVGELVVRDGGRLEYPSTSYPLYIGAAWGGPPTSGSVVVSAAELETISRIRIGEDAYGSLVITNGGTVDCALATVANLSSATGDLQILGPGSQLRCVGGPGLQSNLNVGLGGAGSLLIENGAVAEVGYLFRVGTGSTAAAQGSATIRNAGSMVRAYLVQIGAPAGGSGSLHVVDSARVEADSVIVYNRSILSGDSAVAATVRNMGTIEPGAPHGQLDIEGAFIQQPAGVLGVELAGASGSAACDRVEIAGVATLGGTLNVTWAPGVVPAPGSRYVLLRASAVSDTFAVVNLNHPAARLEYHPDHVALVIAGASAVPGPDLGKFSLRPCYPNPFNPRTTISFVIPASGKATLVVYDVAGRQVRTLINGVVEAGIRNIEWDGRDDVGRDVGSGSYVARIVFGAETRSAVMQLVR